MSLRFHVPSLPDDGLEFQGQNDVVSLPHNVIHHLTNVLRIKDPTNAILFRGDHGEWVARLYPESKSWQAKLFNFLPINRSAPIKITLAQSLVSNDKMDFLIQKAVEMGVGVIQPIIAKRSIIKLSPEKITKKIEHWQKISIAACAQCGLNIIPEIKAPMSFSEYLEESKQQDHKYFILSPKAKPFQMNMLNPLKPTSFLIGPEGGFDATELTESKKAGLQEICFGARILRTETAGLVALASVNTLWSHHHE